MRGSKAKAIRKAMKTQLYLDPIRSFSERKYVGVPKMAMNAKGEMVQVGWKTIRLHHTDPRHIYQQIKRGI